MLGKRTSISYYMKSCFSPYQAHLQVALYFYAFSDLCLCLQCFDGWAAGGHPACKKYGGWWRWALVCPDGVAPSRMVGVSASVNLPLHHKVQKFSSGTGSPGWSRKKGRKTAVCVCSDLCLWFLPTQLYVTLWPCVHSSSRHKPVNTKVANASSSFLALRLRLACPTLLCKGIWISPKIRALPSGTLWQTVGLRKIFATAHRPWKVLST